jgi:hypothetical protein
MPVRLFGQLELRVANIHDESLGRLEVAASPGLDTVARLAEMSESRDGYANDTAID